MLEHKIATIYAAQYKPTLAYGSQPSRLGCGGSFQTTDRSIQLSFGLNPNRPSRPFLVLWHAY
jgi:hypothetical protein